MKTTTSMSFCFNVFLSDCSLKLKDLQLHNSCSFSVTQLISKSATLIICIFKKLEPENILHVWQTLGQRLYIKDRGRSLKLRICVVPIYGGRRRLWLKRHLMLLGEWFIREKASPFWSTLWFITTGKCLHIPTNIHLKIFMFCKISIDECMKRIEVRSLQQGCCEKHNRSKPLHPSVPLYDWVKCSYLALVACKQLPFLAPLAAQVTDLSLESLFALLWWH